MRHTRDYDLPKPACPNCGMSVRATRTVRIACIDCDEQMVEVH